MLETLGTPHSIVYGGKNDTPYEFGHRIEFLSAVRNKALEPLFSGSAASQMFSADSGAISQDTFDELLFMNDITFCAADMLELLLQKRTQGANQACAVDYMDPVIYDRWVLRDIHGRCASIFLSPHCLNLS